MRLGLRWKILILTVLTPLTLGLATLATVHRNVSEHVNSSSIHESLEHSVAVFESMLATRSRALAGGAQIIAQDPRFFSLVMLGPSQRDARFKATVKAMARDFNQIAQTDLFEVVDRRGRMLASVGNGQSSLAARGALVRQALLGRAVEGVLVEKGGQYQVAVTPVRADGRIVGALLLGAEIGPELARALRAQMRCEVTFASNLDITGSTLQSTTDRGALHDLIGTLDLAADADLSRLGVLKVKGGSTEFLTLVRRIPHSDPATPQLYVMQRAFDPEVSFLRQMQLDMLFLAIVAVVAAIFTGWMFSDQITRPVSALVRGARAMEQGNYDEPIEVSTGDEIGYLADRFGEMRKRERAYVSTLEQTSKLKSEFMRVASNELRAPISVIQGYRDLLAAGTLGALTPEQQQALNAIGGGLRQLTRVAEEATHVAQVKGERLVLELREERVAPLLGRAVVAARAAGAARSVEIVTTVAPDVRTARVDSTRLVEAVAQLLTNGIRFTPDGGRVNVRAHAEGARLVIEVEDSGIGMAADRLAHLFAGGPAPAEPARQSAAQGLAFGSTGLGIGLRRTRDIVEAHGGTLRAESREGHGSTFTIELPLREALDEREAA